MTSESFIELVNVASQIATKRNKAIAVFNIDNTYYMVDACKWEQGCPYGLYIMTVEPGQKPSKVLDLAEIFHNLS